MSGSREWPGEWTVSCRDGAGRRRELVVSVRDGQVVLVPPSGEAVALTLLAVGRLRAALREAVVAAVSDED
ncbi:hypothetical protein [Streptoalloteichus hindustanus]|uniref:Uncharacterized protein n=1 Tax=Streptoalloteichus hindustanus TaxID=2017 RepID=A0A1M5Q8A9_STRHI|nr:hypothetical protein [Streptoalloteichus hindustanus]SHH10146.1 hypothetical protein SAMN05444320_12229 [Streptoalloteichus hindustanus]